MIFSHKSNPSNDQVDHDLPPMPREIHVARAIQRVNWKRWFFILLGLALFITIISVPIDSVAIDPAGAQFPLTHEGKAAIALFALAAIWWAFEVVPLGITAIAVGVIQVLFQIRSPRSAFSDFLDPSIWFIFGSIVIGMVFTRTGLSKRIAYRVLLLTGERTSMIYLGAFATIAILTLVMSHTAVAAAVFPLYMAIYSLYDEGNKPTRFGKGLFIGMASVCAVSSLVTLLGSARAPIALGFLREVTGTEISFFNLTYYLLPLAWIFILLLWGLFMVLYKPEQKCISGLRGRLKLLNTRLGSVSKIEVGALVIVLSTLLLLFLNSYVDWLKPIDKTAIILIATLLFYIFNLIEIKDLEELPWNIILLYGGTLSLGFCLWQTGVSHWIGVNLIGALQNHSAFQIVMEIGIILIILSNLLLNMATLALVLPVAIVISGYLGITTEVIFLLSITAAGVPVMLLIGAAPNTIALQSRQFTSREFFKTGILVSLLLMIVLALFVLVIWPLMGLQLTKIL